MTAQLKAPDAPRRLRGRPSVANSTLAVRGAALHEIEGEFFGASVELVYQRGDFDEAIGHDGEHDACLEAALRVPGLPALARDLIRRAQIADRREDEKIARAKERRSKAHGHTKAGACRIESICKEASR